MKKLIVAASLLVVMLVTGSVCMAAPAPQVGVIDFAYCVNHHPDTPNANVNYQKERTRILAEFETKSAGLAPAAKNEMDRQYGQMLDARRAELLRPIQASIASAMGQVAAEKNLAIVVHKNGVAQGGVDITEDVMKKISVK